MLKKLRITVATVAVLFLAFAILAHTAPAQSDKSDDPPQSEKSTGKAASAKTTDQGKKQAAAIDAAKQLLLLMDTDKNGKISKQEWMKFMEAEFDRLDTDHNGELDVKELTQTRLHLRPAVGK